EARRLGAADEALAPLTQVVRALGAMGLGEYVDVDFSIVRGLAYYTGTVFECFDTGRSLRAIAGGGRYDTLLAALGGVDLPAVGFGMGDVVLAELLRDRGLGVAGGGAIDVFVATVTEEDGDDALAITHELRDAGLRVEYALARGPLGKQLKLADTRGARAAIVIGPDDRGRGEVMIKDLDAKTQVAVRRDALVAEARRLVSVGGSQTIPATPSRE
ncbi:MAG TPA: ATP phosphoribosyltransferase regulatory subunit, partial [Gemmatimonadales bacterium]|nr:ATP phosphoribosyltransferase regulatory subunit [Gemmatimonadales bacterium]